MQCPKCEQRMEKVFVKTGIVDRCTGCAGMWFDVLEEQDVAAFARQVDSGSAKVGASFNRVDEIFCPRCPNSALLRMVDAKQPHIWFEACPHCHGRFYDAGEFRDASEHSLMDVVKRFTAKPRS